jgi:uncharacterized membrane protein
MALCLLNRSHMRVAAWLASCALLGCGNDKGITDVGRPDEFVPGADEDSDAPSCESSAMYLDYQNFGAPFMTNWCRGCHGEAVPEGMRGKAPMEVNFDTVDQVRDWQIRITALAGTGTKMPPAGGPSDDERALLVEWIDCGAP